MLNYCRKIISECRSKYAFESYDSMVWSIKCKADLSWNLWSFLQNDFLLFSSRFSENSSISSSFKRRCFYVTCIFCPVLPLFTFIPLTPSSMVAYLVQWRHIKTKLLFQKFHCYSWFGWRLMKLWARKKLVFFFFHLIIISPL